MLTESSADAPLPEPERVTDPIEVRRAGAPEASLLGAARQWAQALETNQRRKQSDGETAELALYDELADADALRTAELALYRAVLASGLMAE
jgi:hypothetical protein